MARLAVRRVAALAAALAILSSARANAQLASLHVRTFSMSVDRDHLRVGERFHLTIAAHVDERVLELDNVTLPDLSGFDAEGDERRCRADGRGTDCSETLTLVPTVTGDRTIAATVMDAIDGRNGKPSRFATNTIELYIADAPFAFPAWIWAVLWSIVLAILPLGFVILAAWALIWGFGRRTAARAIVPVAPSAPAAIDPDARLRDLVATLAREPSRTAALAVRAALRARIGARADETFADIAARRQIVDRERVLAALAAIERASFCEDARVGEAVMEALPSLNF